MGKRALVLLANGFEDIETVTPVDLMRRAGMQVTVAGVQDKTCTGARGIVVTADCLLKDAQGEEFDVIVAPGGGAGAKNLSQSAAVGERLNAQNAKEGWIAAICASPAVVLSPLGILKGRRATCFTGMESAFPPDCTYTDERVTVSKNLITGKGAGTAYEFGLKIIECLVGKAEAEKVAKQTLYI